MILRNIQLNFGSKHLLISGLAAFFLVFLAWLVVRGPQSTAAQTPEGQVTVEGKIELTPGGDLNQNGEVDAGDTAALTFRIRNLTDRQYQFAKLVTGVDDNLFYDIWNLQGAASLSEENNTISFPNLLLPPHSKQFVTVEATVKYFTEGQQRLTLTPQLLDQQGSSIGTIIPNDHADRPIGLWVGELPTWVAFPGVSPSPSPTATPEPSPEPTPTLEPSSTATPEPTFTPSVVEGPTSTPAPTLEPSLTPSPTFITTSPTP